MATTEERVKILKLVQDGKISADQGVQLLEALQEPNKNKAESPSGQTKVPQVARWFRVSVTDTDTGKVRVNVRLPVNLITAGVKMGARFSPEVEGLDMEQLMTLIKAGEIGKIVDVVDEKDGEHVEVFLE
jgi:Asp-tRNA(Asn)/Glu-tRNA(Gln) amidotransferase B subunit